MDLHPVIVLVSVTVGSALFGLIGGFLAVPAAAMFAVAYRYGQRGPSPPLRKLGR